MDRRTFLRTTTSTALVAAGVGGIGLGLTETAEAATTRKQAGKPRVPGSTRSSGGPARSVAYFGLFQAITQAGISDPESFEAQLGRRMAINHSFRQPPEAPWGPLKARMLRDKKAGRVPMLSYAAGEKPGIKNHQTAAMARLKDIAAGRRDTFIDGQAEALAALHTPVFFRFTWEFDRRYPGAAGAKTFRLAWRHVWERFQAKGATNVAFVWCPSWLGFQDGSAASFYPGDRYVDWVGADGYSREPDYRSFASMFTRPHDFAVKHHKPFMVCETGVNRLSSQTAFPLKTTRQSTWLDGLRADLNANAFPAMKALLYFHVDGDNTPLSNHWQVVRPSDGAAFTAFKALAWHPRLQGKH